MNQDFTEKKATFVSKKKFMQFHLKKKILHKQWAKKNIRACWKFPSSYHFSNGPSLN